MTTHVGTIYSERQPSHITGGIDCTAYLTPSRRFGYAIVPRESVFGDRTYFDVLFVAIRANGRMEWLSFCDGGKTFEAEAEAISDACVRADACQFPGAQ